MRKTLFGAAMAAIFSASMVMGSFAGEITVEEVLENYAAASAEVTEMNATAAGVADITLSMPEQDMTMGISGNIDMDMSVALDPIAAEITGSMEGSAMGQGGKADMHVYMVPAEDGSLATYAGVDMGEGMEWALTTIDAESVEQFKELLANKAMDFSAMPVEFELADELVEVEGTDCYELVAALTWEDMLAIFQMAVEQAGDAVPEGTLPDEETLQALGTMLGGLQVNMTIDVDAETFRPAYARIDFDGSDWVTLGAVLASVMGATDEEGNLLPLTLDVTDLYLEYFYDYETPVEIEVPQEVIDSAEDMGSTSDLSGVAEEMVGELESEF